MCNVRNLQHCNSNLSSPFFILLLSNIIFLHNLINIYFALTISYPSEQLKIRGKMYLLSYFYSFDFKHSLFFRMDPRFCFIFYSFGLKTSFNIYYTVNLLTTKFLNFVLSEKVLISPLF